MLKVWVVMHCHYYDDERYIEAIFDTEEAAEGFAKQHPNWYSVESYHVLKDAVWNVDRQRYEEATKMTDRERIHYIDSLLVKELGSERVRVRFDIPRDFFSDESGAKALLEDLADRLREALADKTTHGE